MGLPDLVRQTVMANQWDIVLINKQQKKEVVITIQSDSNMGKKEHKKLKKYQGLKEDTGISGIKALGAVTQKLGEWPPSRFKVQNLRSLRSPVLGTSKLFLGLR